MSYVNKEFSKMNYDKEINRDKSKSTAGKYSIEAEQNFNKYLKSLNDERNFNKNLYDKGIEYYNVGGTEENIPNELKNNESFMTGYRYAERFAKINERKTGRGR